MTHVVLSPEARSDLLHIIAYLASVAGAATADKWDRKLRRAVQDLGDFPGSGALRPALGEHTRIWTVHPYVYEHVRGSDTLHVLRVVHGRRNISGSMLRK